ncbi:MAG: hypothetical protein EBZ48_07010 [Proteobacteria bacterium]|nr:hypothetical protein [Pseudomonadota bacterium]
MNRKNWSPPEQPITNRRTGTVYQMTPALHVPVSAEQLDTLVSICNEPAIYEFLFRDKRGGRSYQIEDAKSFFSFRCSSSRPFSLRRSELVIPPCFRHTSATLLKDTLLREGSLSEPT